MTIPILKRQQTVAYFLRHKNIKKTALKYNCSPSSIRRWVKLYATGGLNKVNTKLISSSNKPFTSINKYLDAKASKGPKALPGKIDYHYQNLTNIYNYLYLFLKDSELKKFSCLPDYGLIVRGGVARTACCIDLYLRQIFFPEELVEGIKECMKQPTVRFIFFSLYIYPTKKNFAHVNGCIIDVKNKTLERFEPYGNLDSSKDNIIDHIFKYFALDYLVLSKYSYLSPKYLSPKIGIQTKADSYNGMCVTISILYFKLRILNPNLKPLNLIKKLLKLKNSDLKLLILRFAKFIEKTLKKNSKIVQKLDHNLFTKLIDDVSTSPNLTIKEFEKKYKLN